MWMLMFYVPYTYFSNVSVFQELKINMSILVQTELIARAIIKTSYL